MKSALQRPTPQIRKLRSQAEEALRKTRTDIAQMPTSHVQKLVHELQVHQIELEMQADELRRAQLELEASHERLTQLYNHAPVGYLTLDPEGVIREVNLTAASLLGAGRMELLGERLARYVAPEFQHVLHVHCRRDFAGDPRKSCELRMARPDGTNFVGHLETVLDTPGPGSPARILVVLQDVTERRRSEEIFALFHSVVSNMAEGIAMVRARDGIIVYANPKFESIFGYDPGEMMQKPVGLVHPAKPGGIAAEASAAFMERLTATGDNGQVVRSVRKDGTVIWCELHSSTLRHPAHGPLWVVVYQDITARKTAEATRNRLAAIVHTSSDAIISVMPDGIISSWNRGAERLYGYRPEEIVGRPLATLRPSDRKAEFERVFECVQRGEIVEPFETVRVRKDGSRVDVSLAMSPITDEAGRVTGFSHVARDISARKRAEAGLRELQARLQSILDNSPSMIFLKDTQGRYLLVNRKFGETFHLKPEGAVGRTDVEIFPPKEAAAFTANDRRVLKAGVPMDFDEEVVHDDGLHASIVTKFPLRGADGNIYAIGGIVTDITERKRMEEALRRNERNLAHFFSSAPIGLQWLSAGGTVLRANQAQLDLLGYTETGYSGLNFADFVYEPAAAMDLLGRLAARETVGNLRMQLRRKDGSVRHVLIDAIAEWDSGRFSHSSVFTRDITKRVELEREILSISENEQRRIAQDLHDGLGQLLTGTVYLTNALREDLKANSIPQAGDATKILKVLDEAIGQARRLARGLHPVKLESNGLMAALQELAARTGQLFKIRCRFTCLTPALIEDSEVATHLYRIAQEAVTNAVKHGRAGHVAITLRDLPGRIVMTVKDDGVGLPDVAPAGDGMGLRIMRYRANLVLASLSIQNCKKGGAIVTAVLPKPTATNVPDHETQTNPPKPIGTPHPSPPRTGRAPESPGRGRPRRRA